MVDFDSLFRSLLGEPDPKPAPEELSRREIVEKLKAGGGTNRRRSYVVGFDYGTHSTKVVARKEGDEYGSVLPLNDVADGYPEFASPSLVRVRDGKVYFGATCLKVEGGDLFRSLKVDLLPGLERKQTKFPPGVDAELLVSAYLAWGFARVRQRLPEQGKVFINVAAPMNHVEDPRLKHRYLRIINAAWEFAFASEPATMNQGISLSRLRDSLCPLMKRSVPDPSIRQFDVLAETVAPIVSLSLDPRMEPGMYMIADMGAGTTELSVFHVSEPGADQTVVCYYDESFVLGGDAFAWADSQQQQKREKEYARLVGHLLKQLRKTFAIGYQKDAPNRHSRRRWDELNIVVSGGGMKRYEVEQAVIDCNPIYHIPPEDSACYTCDHEPIVDVEEGSEQDTSILAVANGLSIHRKKWPDLFPPRLVETQEPDEKPQPVAAYWYLED